MTWLAIFDTVLLVMFVTVVLWYLTRIYVENRDAHRTLSELRDQDIDIDGEMSSDLHRNVEDRKHDHDDSDGDGHDGGSDGGHA